MLGRASAWVGDHLWTGKPPRHRTRHPGLLSRSALSVVRLEWVAGESWGSKQAYHVIHRPVSMVSQCLLMLESWLAEISANVREVVAHQRLCGDALYKYAFTLLYILSLQTGHQFWQNFCCRNGVGWYVDWFIYTSLFHQRNGSSKNTYNIINNKKKHNKQTQSKHDSYQFSEKHNY